MRRDRAREATAYHEAGQAVAAYVHRARLHRATIKPGDGYTGLTYHGNPLARRQPDAVVTTRDRRRLEALAIVALAGIEAQRRHAPRSVRGWHAQRDFHNAVDLVTYLVGSGEALNAYLKLVGILTVDFLRQPHVWSAVEAVAAALLRETTIGERELRRIIRNTIQTARPEMPSP